MQVQIEGQTFELLPQEMELFDKVYVEALGALVAKSPYVVGGPGMDAVQATRQRNVLGALIYALEAVQARRGLEHTMLTPEGAIRATALGDFTQAAAHGFVQAV